MAKKPIKVTEVVLLSLIHILLALSRAALLIELPFLCLLMDCAMTAAQSTDVYKRQQWFPVPYPCQQLQHRGGLVQTPEMCIRDRYYGLPGHLWQQTICWVFILLSGFCVQLGHHTMRRGAQVFGAGALWQESKNF